MSDLLTKDTPKSELIAAGDKYWQAVLALFRFEWLSRVLIVSASTKIVTISAVFVLSFLLALDAPRATQSIESLRFLATGGNPYFVPEFAWLLNIYFPLIAVGASVLIMAPGLCVSLVFRRYSSDFFSWLLHGFIATVALLLPIAWIAGTVLARTPTQAEFTVMIGALTLAGLVTVNLRDRKSAVDWSIFEGKSTTLCAMFAVPFLAIALFGPKFYWEDMNGDGVDLYLTTQMFIGSMVPALPQGISGGDYLYPAEAAFYLVPSGWFQLVFGGAELTARLPILLGLGLMIGGVMEFIARWQVRYIGWRATSNVAAASLLFFFVIAYQTSYNPYFADIASPAGREPFVVFLLLGALHFYLKWQPRSLFAVLLLGCFTVPSMPVLLGFWLIAVALFGPFVTKRQWAVMVGAMAFAVAVAKIAPLPFLHLEGIIANPEFSAGNISRRLRFIDFTQVDRLWYWIIPGGFLPAASLLLWPWQDRLSRCLTLMVVGYVLFFSVQAYRILPHHFTPAMIVPIIVFWRTMIGRVQVRAFSFLAPVCLLLALFLSWPATMRLHMDTSELAASVRFDDYVVAAPELEHVALIQRLFSDSFQADFSDNARNSVYIFSARALALYFDRDKVDPDNPAYEIRQADTASVFDAPFVLAQADGFVLSARNEQTFLNDRSVSHVTRSLGNPRYYVSRNQIFGIQTPDTKGVVIDVAKLLRLR